MPFSYTVDSANDQVVFSRASAGCVRFLFLFAGVLFTVVGYFFVSFMKGNDDFVFLMKFFVPLFGIGSIYVGIMLPKIQGKTTPDKLIFDNKNGRIEIRQMVSNIQTSYIYYDEVADFIIKKKKRESNNSGRSHTTSYSYHIYLTTKGGGHWELLQTNSQDNAEKEIANLRQLIPLGRTPQRVAMKMNDCQKYTLSEGLDKTELSWRNKVGFGPLVLAIFAGVFITVLYTIGKSFFSPMGDVPIFVYGVFGFIGIVFILVTGGNAWKMIKNSRTEYVLVITRRSLDYIERGFDGLDRKTTEIPMSELHSVAFSFDSETIGRSITIYTHELFAKKDTIGTSFSMESIKDIFHFQKDLMVLDVQDMTAVEALEITQYLNQQIRQKGNREAA